MNGSEDAIFTNDSFIIDISSDDQFVKLAALIPNVQQALP